MRLIDADKLRKDVIDLPDLYNGFSDTYDKSYILGLVDEQPTVKSEPTEEQVKEYCRKRCLVVVDSGLFNEMKARWSAVSVVRCKDCKWRGELGCAITIVDESDKPTDDDFCSWGERREEHGKT